MSGKRNTARAFGAAPRLLPYIPRLLAGLWSLGVPPETVVKLLQDQDCAAEADTVLDLGCGKGAISITLARQFGFRVYGIDFFAPFIEEARERARDLGVSDICRFETGDIKKTVRGSADYDMVMLIWMGSVLGSAGESVQQIRRLVRPQGYMVIGDGCLKGDAKADHPFLYRFTSRDIMLKQLTMYGDVIQKEMVIPPDTINPFYRDYIDSLKRGAEECATGHPEHAGILWEYVNTHEEICRTMEDTIASCLWMLKKEGT